MELYEQLQVQEEGGLEKDGEVQVEVEREEGELKEKRSCARVRMEME